MRIFGLLAYRKYLLEVEDFLLPTKSNERTTGDSFVQIGDTQKEGHGGVLYLAVC